MGVIPELPEVEVGAEEDTITDKEQLALDIAAALKYAKRTKNVWALKALMLMQREYDNKYAFDEEGAEAPIQEESNIPNIQVSPLAAVLAEGWWTAIPKGISKIPRWAKDVDLTKGLEISRSRSNGCVIVRNMQDTATTWINEAKEVAETIGGNVSPRVIQLAGHLLDGYRYLLPTANIGGYNRLSGFALDPRIPYTQNEQDIFAENFAKYHMYGSNFWGWGRNSIVGAHNQKQAVLWEGIPVDPDNKHLIVTVANHPDWILLTMMGYFNTAKFKNVAYRKAMRLAHAIDRGAARVYGYTHPLDWGAKEGEQGLQEWYKAKEVTDIRKGPRFKPGGENI